MKLKVGYVLSVLVYTILTVTASASELSYTALCVGSNAAYVDDVKQQIDIDNPDVCVFVENDRSYVPVRFISESYNGQVEWLTETQTVNIAFADRTISLTI